MKKTYSTPEIQLHGMNTSEAFMALSAAPNEYGISGGKDASKYEGGAPTPDARQFADNVENDWDE